MGVVLEDNGEKVLLRSGLAVWRMDPSGGKLDFSCPGLRWGEARARIALLISEIATSLPTAASANQDFNIEHTN